ncbi:MAG: hypothetical protein QOJ13_1184 [Gaiellales bacterium]|nr:hypothetical protein [Gaiellales bacterium]
MSDQPTDPPQSGIDANAGVDEIRDALERQGLELDIKPANGGFEAVSRPALGEERETALRGSGPTEHDAAREVWARYVAVQGGVGSS